MLPPEEVKRQLVQQWLRKAEEDFAVAKCLVSVSENAPYLEAVGFHTQRAVEKFLKAFLVHHQVEFPKTHDLDEVLDLVATVNDPLADSLRDVIVLSEYGVDIRYPGDAPEITEEGAERAVELAGKVRDAVCGALKE